MATGLLGMLLGNSDDSPVLPGLLDKAGYMDPAAYDRARSSQSMDGLWAGLLAGSGPSLTPRNFYSALGQGMEGRQQFGTQFDKSQEAAAQAALARAGVQKSAYDITSRKRVLDFYEKWGEGGGAEGSGSTAQPGAAGTGAGGSGGTGKAANFGAGGAGSISPADHYTFLLNNGASHNEATLLTAAAGAESSFRPDVSHDGGIGYGLYGHNSERLTGMRSFAGVGAKDPVPWQQQSLYALAELRGQVPGGGELKAGEMARAAKTPEQLTAAQLAFERPDLSKNDGNRAGRLALTNQYFNNPPYRQAADRAPVAAGAPAGPVEATAAGARPSVFDFQTGRGNRLENPDAPLVPDVLGGGRTVAAAPAPAAMAPQAATLEATATQAVPWNPGNMAQYTRPGDKGGPTTVDGVTYPSVSAWNRAMDARAVATAATARTPLPGATTPGQGAGLGAPPDRVVAAGPLPQVPGLNGIPPAMGGAPNAQLAAMVSGGSGGRLPAGPAPTNADTVVPPDAPAPAAMVPGGALPGGARATPELPTSAAATPPAMPTPIPAGALPAAPGSVAVRPAPQMPPAGPPVSGMSPAEAADIRKAQALTGMMATVGIPIPEWLAKRAGRQEDALSAAAQARAKQPIDLQNEQFRADLAYKQKEWDALNDQEKETLAASRGLQKSQYESALSQAADAAKQLYGAQLSVVTTPFIEKVKADENIRAQLKIKENDTQQDILKKFDEPFRFPYKDENLVPRERITTLRELAREQAAAQGVPLSPALGGPGSPGYVAPAGTAPAPAGTQPPPAGFRTGMSPREESIGKGVAELDVKDAGTIRAEGQAAAAARPSTTLLLAMPKVDWQGPLASGRQEFNRLTTSLLGLNVDSTATYEQAAQLTGESLRAALRASDPNPTAQQAINIEKTFPTFERSALGRERELRYLAGFQDYKIAKDQALQAHMNDPSNPSGDPRGFNQKFQMSAIPFIFARMLPAEQESFIAKLATVDKAQAQRLLQQASSIGSTMPNLRD